MKLIIQIPCYNEAATLPAVLAGLPRRVEDCDTVEWLLIDDGSTDGSAEIARAHGVDHLVRLARNQGLARAFMAGLETSLRLGADIIVTIDADNQYDAADIPALVRPIAEKRAELVVGARPIASRPQYPFLKKYLQRLGSWVVRLVSGTDIADAPSGFRAMSRDAALRFNVFSDYTYTLETIIQAGQKQMAVLSVPVGMRDDVRQSRLVKSIPAYVKRSVDTIVRIFVVYRPFRFFAAVGTVLFSAGFLIGMRFLYHYLQGSGSGHVQSLILASVLLGIGVQAWLVAFLADLLAVNRRLLEDVQYRLRKTGDGQDVRRT